MYKKRGQISVEMIVIVSIVLVLLLGVMFFYFDVKDVFSTQIEEKKARALVDEIGDAAEMVYQQGVGSRTKLFVAMPRGVNYVNITGSRILMNLNTPGGTANFYRNLGFNVSGNIPVSEGNAWVYVESKTGYVDITRNVTVKPTQTCSEQSGYCCAIGYSCGGSTYTASDCGTCCNQVCTETTPDVNPPASVTNLDNQSIGQTWIYWTWTNPSDADFDHVEIWIDGTPQANISSPTAYYNATGLSSSTAYEIQTRTVDTTGNVNQTWMNDTATTAAAQAVTITRWATQDSPLASSSTGAPDNVFDSATSVDLYGYNFDVSGLNGTINKVILIWSHEVPEAFSDDAVHMHFGLTAYDDYLYMMYDSGNTPFDYMGTTPAEWDYYDATSARSWAWADFASLMVGGDYVKSGEPDSQWRLDAVGVNITYTP